ncbi:hypothetical protein AAG742_05255 [Micrococcus sp. 2A]|uniref:hypothetical protein n=1 Tax=unclassified Micrococcus TaxID=2620948 RepID=UPI002623E9C6|nr:hypothetical protein [Micrococcus sp. M4NT]MDX2340996.1 hypothetical protein [Micrococcus sp. M4NT]
MTGFAQDMPFTERARFEREVRRAERAIPDARLRLAAAAAAGLGCGVASLIPLGRLPHVRTAAAFGGAVALLIPSGAWAASVRGGGSASSAGPVVDGPRQAVALAAGSVGIGTVLGVSLWLSLKADAGLERLAVRRGARHPRRWMGVAGGVLGGLVEFAERTPPSAPHSSPSRVSAR